MINNSVRYLEQLVAAPAETDSANAVTGESTDASSLDPARENESADSGDLQRVDGTAIRKQGRVDSLIWAFREVGYLYADLNPLGSDYQEHYTNLPAIRKGVFEKLTPYDFDLDEGDMKAVFFGGPALAHERKTLEEIIAAYSRIYCSNVGIEFLHIQNKPVRRWFVRNLEESGNLYAPSVKDRKVILEDLVAAYELERFLHANYVGQKRFSIEGAEAVIPCLHFLVNRASALGVREIVIGTTHRGRLTILNRILQVPPEDIFSLFEENFDPDMVDGGGDVKYHLGYSTEHVHEDGTKIRITLPPNSSHLESVDPVVEGRARGIQDSLGAEGKARVIPVLIHGDAAFSGQGVAAETLNFSGLTGYSTGGTIHVIINNQVGFTASTRDEHSSSFVTDLAKSIACPVLHVNGDYPDDVVRVMSLALAYRQEFMSDVVVDVICYRRYGHNEGDDPSFTHPHMYEIIRNHASVSESYSRACIEQGVATSEEAERIRAEFRGALKLSLDMIRKNKDYRGFEGFTPHKIKYFDSDLLARTNVGIDRATVDSIVRALHAVPGGYRIHDKLKRILEARYRAYSERGVVDWSLAESIAFASLLLDGHGVRFSGQDSERGTFSQRHLVWWELGVDQPISYVPLNHIADRQAVLSVFDSPLSEYSVLGFELGYSIARPDSLVIWEAQFGDFANGAQVTIDNYIAPMEAKWNLRSSLVLLLPHGYEGQGPEHSNAHMDRFLQLCAQENMQVANVTTPAQYFSLLRRQIALSVEKPLVIMTPKSLLRHPLALSSVDDITEGLFRFVIDDIEGEPGDKKRLVFCTGKIYYELAEKRKALLRTDTAIVRIEQLYPFPKERIASVRSRYANAKRILWVQEEPRNKGAWSFVKYQFESTLGESLGYVGRPPSASPATGSLARFRMEQEKIAEAAFGDE